MTERPSFLSAIVELQLSTRLELDEALVRQLIYGQDLATNILELGLVSEVGLGQALQRSSGFEQAAPPFTLERNLTTRLLDRGHSVVVEVRGDETRVIGSDVKQLSEHQAEFSEALARPIQVAIGLSFRVEEALADVRGVAPDARTQALLDRLGARPPAVIETQVSAPPPLVEEIQRASAQPVEIATVEPPPAEIGITEPPPGNYAQITREAAAKSERQRPVISKAPAPSAHAPSRLAPSHKALKDARDRDAIFKIVLGVAAHHFEYAALFAVSGSEARGLSSAGKGRPREDLSGLKIPLDLASPFSKAVQAGAPQLARIRASGLEGGVAQDLERPTGHKVLLLPVVLRGRSVLLLWGDQGSRDVELDQVSDVIALGPEVALAFERVLLERKRNSMIPQSAAAIGKLSGMMPDAAALAAPAAPLLPETPPLQAPEPPPPAAPDVVSDAPAIKISLASEYKPGPVEEAAVQAPGFTIDFSGEPPTGVSTAVELGAEKPAAPKRLSDLPPPPVSDHEPTAAPPLGSKRPLVQRPSPRPVSRFGPSSERTADVDTGPVDSGHVETQRVAAAPEARAQDAAQNLAEADEKLGALEVAPNAPRKLDQDPTFPSEGPRTWKGFPGSPLPPDVTPEAPPPPVIAPAAATPSPLPPLSIAMTPRRMVAVDSKGLELKVNSPLHRPSQHAATPAPSPLQQSPLQQALADAPAPFLAPPKGELRPSGTLISRRPLMNEPPEDGWGTTIVPAPSRRPVAGPRSYDELIERLFQGEESALERLVDGGESAVASLIARFPGPVTEPSSAQVKASDCGPILLALVRLGPKSIPFLTVRTADENPEVRRWATLVLGELPNRDSAKAIADRLLDGAPAVRRAALSSARRLQADLLARRTLRSQIEELALDVRLGTDARVAAVEALADIREYESIPTLLRILGEKDRSVARASQWALSVLTRQDFGSDFVQWQAFWLEHRDEPRTEWLIAALAHEKPELRRAAYEELKVIAAQDFGFHEDLPLEERNEIQALIRTWWTRSGSKS